VASINRDKHKILGQLYYPQGFVLLHPPPMKIKTKSEGEWGVKKETKINLNTTRKKNIL
jgi:hypothetical protein